MYAPKLNHLDVSNLVDKIKEANSIVLSTHKQCDGDGLGASLALYHALKKIGKDVRVIFVDPIPTKYHFLDTAKYIEIFESPHNEIKQTDLVLIFDTNDQRLVEPLYSQFVKKSNQILFVDHHPILNDGPKPTPGSFVETRAASTGEISYYIIKALGIRFDKNIARSLYTSVIFDTQLFRFVRGSSSSYLICAELLEFEKNPEEIHRELLSTYTIDKIQFLGEVLSKIEYFGGGKIAALLISMKNLSEHNLDVDESRDVIDMIMNITSLHGAAVFREDGQNLYKLSLRSKGHFEVLGIAESFDGGGHIYAAGALLEGEYSKLRDQVVEQLLQRLDKEILSK